MITETTIQPADTNQTTNNKPNVTRLAKRCYTIEQKSADKVIKHQQDHVFQPWVHIDIDKIKHPHKRGMIQCLARTDSVTKSVKAVGVHRMRHYQWMKEDAGYAEYVEIAREAYLEKWEAELERRAIDGVETVTHDKDGTEIKNRKYSDVLMIFRMKSLNRGKYADRTEQAVQNQWTLNVVQQEFMRLPPHDQQERTKRAIDIITSVEDGPVLSEEGNKVR